MGMVLVGGAILDTTRLSWGLGLDSNSDRLLHGVRVSQAYFSYNYPVRFGQIGSFSADAGG